MPTLEPLTYDWTDIYGQTHSVTVQPRNNDTRETLQARLDHIVELLQEEFPEAH